MGKYNINVEAFEIYKNSPARTTTEYKKEFNNVIHVINNFLENKNYDSDDDNIFFQIKYLYNNIPPKTSRYLFRKQIEDLNSIPQKDIQITKINEFLYETILTYKISLEEFNEFKNDLNLILKNKDKINENDFPSINSSLQIKIAQISLAKEIQKIPRRNSIKQMQLIKLYKMYDDMKKFLEKIGISTLEYDEILNIIILDAKEFETIKEKCPWIIMGIEKLSTLSVEILNLNSDSLDILLPSPKINTPIIGVIDSGNSLSGDFKKYIDGNYSHIEPGGYSDFSHGSAVASLIIANDELNPSAKDNLGNFKVRHFEILSKPSENSSSVTVSFNHLNKKIEEIVASNKDIKIWNLSLGALKSPWTLMISHQGMLLDYLSFKYNCLFVIASGNDRVNSNDNQSLNIPGDSLNALTVGSVSYNDFTKKVNPSSYSSIGTILHFIKPEVSHFGGENNFDGSPLIVYENSGMVSSRRGTSLSTPRISRLAGWLLKEGYSLLEIKAMIIASAQKEAKLCKSSAYGFIKDFDETLVLKTTFDVNNNRPHYLHLNLENVEEVTLSSCNMVVPVSSLGMEYSISDVDVKLIQYRPDYRENGLNTPERNKNFKITLDAVNSGQRISEFSKEKHRRYSGGKYFTSKRVIYNLNKKKNNLVDQRWVYALWIKRTDLFKLTTIQPLKLGIVLKLNGTNLNEEKFIQHNSIIIDIDIDVDIEINK